MLELTKLIMTKTLTFIIIILALYQALYHFSAQGIYIIIIVAEVDKQTKNLLKQPQNAYVNGG